MASVERLKAPRGKRVNFRQVLPTIGETDEIIGAEKGSIVLQNWRRLFGATAPAEHATTAFGSGP
jgi:hypothetical protein